MQETTYEAYRPPDYSRDARKDVAIAVVSHNHLRFLDALFRSVYGQAHRSTFDLTLVDNVGQPEIAELIRNRYPQARLLVNRCRKGFAVNNNMVLVGTQARYAFLLNPDTELQPGALDALVGFMDGHPGAGACGPRLRYPDGRVQFSCRCFPTLGSFIVRRTPLRAVLRNSSIARRYEMADWDHESQRRVDWLFGAAILIRQETLEDVGGLDESMFMYSEDVDWCLRCHLAGWDIYYVPRAEIFHHLDDHKYNSFFTRHRMMHYRTMARFVRKHWRHCLRM